jgi:hypothetical protein
MVNPGVGCGQVREVPLREGQPVPVLRDHRERVRRGVRRAGLGAQEERRYQKPERMDFVQAASVPLVFLTAHHMLVREGGGPGRARRCWSSAPGPGVGSRGHPDSEGLRGERGGHGRDRRQAAEEPTELGADSVVNHNTQDLVAGGEEVHRRPWGRRGGGARREGHVGEVASGRSRKGGRHRDLRRDDWVRRARRTSGTSTARRSRSYGSFMGGAWGAANRAGALQAAAAASGGRPGVSPQRRGPGRPDTDGEGRAVREDRACRLGGGGRLRFFLFFLERPRRL